MRREATYRDLPTLRDLRRVVARGGLVPAWAVAAIGHGFGAARPDGGVDWAPDVDGPAAAAREIDRLISRHGARAPLVINLASTGAPSMTEYGGTPVLAANREESASPNETLSESDGDATTPQDGGMQEEIARGNAGGDDEAGQPGGAGHPAADANDGAAPGAADGEEEGASTGRQDGPGQDSAQAGAAGQNAAGQGCGPQPDGEPENAGMGSGDGSAALGVDTPDEGQALDTPSDRPAADADGSGGPSHKLAQQEEASGGEAGSPPEADPQATAGHETQGQEEEEEQAGQPDGAGHPAQSEAADENIGAGHGGGDPSSHGRGSATSIAAANLDELSEMTAVEEVEMFAGSAMAPSIRITVIEEAMLDELRRQHATRRAQRAIERMLRAIIAPRGRRGPLLDERKLVREIVTRRFAISRARQERGQPRRIIITPDGSGSCSELVETTMPVARALQREMPGTIIVVPNANGCPYVNHDDWAHWPEALREIGRDKGVMPGGDPYYDSAPIGFWGRVLRERIVDAILYLGDHDANQIWQELEDDRIIAVRLSYYFYSPEELATPWGNIAPAKPIDIMPPATPSPQRAAWTPTDIQNAIARALERTKIRL